MSIPAKCKAAVANQVGAKLEIVDIDVPEPQEGEILIKVHACGICHSDSHAIDGAFGSTINWPLIPGHESVGTVVKLGPGVTEFKGGELVGGAWTGGWDGTCIACRRGAVQMCDKPVINGVSRNGGYAEYTTLRAQAAVRLPSDMDKAELAPLLCAGVTVFNSIRNMQTRAGGLVAILGLGGLGHMAVQYARKMGYRTVALSRGTAKRDFAMNQLGATDYVDTSSIKDAVATLKAMGGADLIVITAPSGDSIESLVTAAAPMGKILMLSANGSVSVNSTYMLLKGVSVQGWPSGGPLDSEEAIAFAKLANVTCMVERFPLARAQEAMDHMLSGKVRFRCVLVMD